MVVCVYMYVWRGVWVGGMVWNLVVRVLYVLYVIVLLLLLLLLLLWFGRKVELGAALGGAWVV